MTQKQVLFLCTGNSCRSQMAEALVNALLPGIWHAYSAGTQPSGFVHPLALAALAEIDITHSGKSKSVEVFRGQPFDMVVTLCDSAAETCPVWLEAGRRVHLSFPDPAKTEGSPTQKMEAFRAMLKDMQVQIPELLLTVQQED